MVESNMTLYALILWSCFATTWAEQSCLTGMMTDMQSWVDKDGRLTVGTVSQCLDVSGSADSVSSLRAEMLSQRHEMNNVVYMSMAKCQLREVPQVFTYEDGKNRSLADTIEYLTLYGNQFDDHQSTGDRYDSYINATGARTLANGMGYDSRATAAWPGGFMGVVFKNLKELDLRACAITTLSGGAFEGMTNLEALYLSENKILFINAKAFAGLQKLTHLDLSRNYNDDEFGNHKSLVLESVEVMEDLKNLVSLDFSCTRLAQSNLMMFAKLGKQFQRLSICETGLTKLRQYFFANTSLRYLDISGNNAILNNNEALSGIARTLEALYAAKIGLRSLDMLERFTRLEILNVQSNEINEIRPETAKTLKSLQVLDLDGNRIKTWFDRVFSYMPRLKYLSLRKNNINMVNENMIEDFKAVHYVGISGNFVICSCHSRELFELALKAETDENINETVIETAYKNNSNKFINFHTGFREYNRVICNRNNVSEICNENELCDGEIYDNTTNGMFLIFDYDPMLYQCLQMTDGNYISYSRVAGCNQTRRNLDYEDVIQTSRKKLIAIILIPGILIPIFVFAYMFRKNFRYFCITVRNSALLSMINKDKVIDDSRIFNYDVFVSYCNEDRGWILDQLLPHLETTCGVSVCLHERDFQVGLSILENIVSCMDRSRTIMLVLSRQFLLSQWCQFEMHLAQHRLLETRREDLILVLLEDIPRRLRPTTLHYLMLTKTYIVYPSEGSEAARRDFWKRLGRSVTARRPDNENDSLA